MSLIDTYLDLAAARAAGTEAIEAITELLRKGETIPKTATALQFYFDWGNGAAEVRLEPLARVRAELLQVIEPISGDVSLVKYEAVFDQKGKVQGYRVWVKRKP